MRTFDYNKLIDKTWDTDTLNLAEIILVERTGVIGAFPDIKLFADLLFFQTMTAEGTKEVDKEVMFGEGKWRMANFAQILTARTVVVVNEVLWCTTDGADNARGQSGFLAALDRSERFAVYGQVSLQQVPVIFLLNLSKRWQRIQLDLLVGWGFGVRTSLFLRFPKHEQYRK